jgi:type IX secretion system PorP/SprF family membrane protein
MKYILLVLGLLFINLSGYSQQLMSDQFIGSPVLVNPAACGQYSGYTISTGYRRQWVGLENAPSSFNAIVEYKFPGFNAKSKLDVNKGLPLMGKWALVKPPKLKSGRRKIRSIIPPDSIRFFYSAGLRLQTENIGFVSRTKAGLMINTQYNLFNERFISVGVQVGFQATQLNTNNAILEDQAELSRLITKSGTVLNLGIGAFYYSPNLIAGLSVMDIGTNSQSFFPNSMGDAQSYPFTVIGTLGYIRRLSPTVELIPATTIRYSAGYNATIVDFTAKALFKEQFMAGAGYRTTGAPLLFLGYLLDKQYSFNYCYGLQQNSTFENARSTHEIMFSMNLQNKASRLIPTKYRWR